MSDTYWEVEVDLAPEAEELWTWFCFEQGVTGAETLCEALGHETPPPAFVTWAEAPTPMQRPADLPGPLMRMRYFYELEAQPDVAAWLKAFEAEYPGQGLPTAWRVRAQGVEDWASSWQVHFQPLPVGQRLIITPPWCLHDPQVTDSGRLPLIINPGQGFGTGTHATTYLALSMVESLMAQRAAEGLAAPEAMADVGTGSGILALGACMLGVGHAVVCDTDPASPPEARENFALSGLPAPTAVVGGPEAIAAAHPAPFGLVTANIVTPVLKKIATQVAALVAPPQNGQPGGTLVLCGILAAEAQEVEEAYRAHGFHAVANATREGWVALRLEKE